MMLDMQNDLEAGQDDRGDDAHWNDAPPRVRSRRTTVAVGAAAVAGPTPPRRRRRRATPRGTCATAGRCWRDPC